MAITPNSTIRADDFINKSEKNATPSSDAGKVPKIEADGYVHPVFFKGFGGSGIDGALDTSGGTVDINLGGEQIVIKQYSSINIVTNNLTFSNPHANGTIVIIKCSGDATISATIDLKGKGATKELAGTSMIVEDGQGVGGGDKDDPVTPNTSVRSYTPFYATSINNIKLNKIYLCAGAGGGDGGNAYKSGDAVKSNGGNGGRGGGAIYMEIAGALNFTGTIDLRGDNGSNGFDAVVPSGPYEASSGGGGGGGAGGIGVIIAGTITSSSGTINTAGGAGGNGGSATAGGANDDSGYGRGGAGGASVLGIGGGNANANAGSGTAGGISGGGGGGNGVQRTSAGTGSGGTGGAGGSSYSTKLITTRTAMFT